MRESDRDLLRAYVERSDAAAFGELVRRRIDFVYTCALRQLNGDQHRANDLTQEVFIAVARKAATLLHHPSLLGWLCTATRFAAVDVIRSEQSRRAREEEASAMQSSSDATPPDWNRLQPVLDSALSELPERDRDAVLARYFDRQSFAEIASDFGLSENAAQKRVDRALDKLRDALARHHITSTSAALGLVLAGQSGAAAPAGLALSVTESALAAGTTSAGAAGGTGILFLLMKKQALALAALAAMLGVGTTFWGLRADESARRQFAAAQQTTAALSREVRALEQRMSDSTQRAQRAERANAELLRQAKTLREISITKASANEEITADFVMRRVKSAQQLVENGDPAEALRELLWCYDIGMPRISSLGPARTTMLMFFGRLGERYPPVLDVLRERREKARETARSSSAGLEAVQEYTMLNRALKDHAENIAFLETLPAGDSRRRTVASASQDYLMEHQRYAEAAEGRPYSFIQSMFELIARRPLPANTTDPERSQRELRESVVKMAATDIEMLAGAGDLANARAHAARVLAFANSADARARLLKGATRAGHPEVIPPTSP